MQSEKTKEIIELLNREPGRWFLLSEVGEYVRLSRGATYAILLRLAKEGIASEKFHGGKIFYQIRGAK